MFNSFLIRKVCLILHAPIAMYYENITNQRKLVLKSEKSNLQNSSKEKDLAVALKKPGERHGNVCTFGANLRFLAPLCLTAKFTRPDMRVFKRAFQKSK